jgi:DNA topoisomerase-3
LKQQITDIVQDVMKDPSNRRVSITPDEEQKKKGKSSKKPPQKQ